MRYTDQEYEESDTEEELGPGEAVNTHLLRGPGTSHSLTCMLLTLLCKVPLSRGPWNRVSCTEDVVSVSTL